MRILSLTIQQRIMLLSVTLLLLLGIIGGAGIISLNTVSENSLVISEKILPATELILNLDRDAQQAMVALRSELLAGNAEWKKRQSEDFEANVKQIFERWDKYKAIGQIVPEEKVFQKAFEEKRLAWLNSAKKIQRLAQEGTPYGLDQAGIMIENDGKLFEDMRDQLDQLEDLYEKHSNNTEKALANTVRNTIKMLAVVFVGGVLAGIGLEIVIGRSVTNPIFRVIGRLEDLVQGEGDLTKRLDVSRNDEIGQMTKLTNTFLEKLQQTIKGVRGNVLDLASVSQQLSSNAGNATQATQQVSRAIEHVSKRLLEESRNTTEAVNVIGQVAQAIEQIAAGAQEQSKNIVNSTVMVNAMVDKINIMANGMETVKQVAEQNGVVAVNGGKSVEKTVKGMLRVKDAVFDTAQRIHELGEQSQKIGEIIQVIDDIAEQTNLLALNAAIEAARAGEHGKGFAVVADEVRKLAERSGRATKEIAQLITGIQRGTKVAVESMEVGTREVEEGVELAQEAGEYLNEIVNGVKTTGDNVHKITGLLGEILNSSRVVSQAVDNVAAITEENTAATEEISASSEQVKSSIQNINSISRENADVAGEVSASTEELYASVAEITASIEQLTEMFQDLRKLVGWFRV